MTQEERKKLYKRALRDFTLSRWIPLYRIIKDTDNGFCWYFTRLGYVCIFFEKYNDFLPELLEQKPLTNSVFWFKPKALKPRIECLKRAIKLCDPYFPDPGYK